MCAESTPYPGLKNQGALRLQPIFPEIVVALGSHACGIMRSCYNSPVQSRTTRVERIVAFVSRRTQIQCMPVFLLAGRKAVCRVVFQCPCDPGHLSEASLHGGILLRSKLQSERLRGSDGRHFRWEMGRGGLLQRFRSSRSCRNPSQDPSESSK